MTKKIYNKVFTYEELVAISKECQGRRHIVSQFHRAAKEAAIALGVYDELFPPVQQKRTEEEILAIAKKYTRRGDFFRGDGASYAAARKIGEVFFEQCCAHMEQTSQAKACQTRTKTNKARDPKPLDSKKKNEIIRIAISFESLKAFYFAHTNLYVYATKYHFLDEIKALYPSVEQLDAIALPKAIAMAKTCDTIDEFKQSYRDLWNVIERNPSARPQAYGHTESYARLPAGHWSSRENCLASAKKYQTRSDWAQSEESAAYNSALKNGWEECFAHMNTKVKSCDTQEKGTFYLVRITPPAQTFVDLYANEAFHEGFWGFGITAKWGKRLPQHISSAAKKGYGIELIASHEASGKDVRVFETLVKQELRKQGLIINTQIDGFKAEATNAAGFKFIEQSLDLLKAA